MTKPGTKYLLLIMGAGLAGFSALPSTLLVLCPSSLLSPLLTRSDNFVDKNKKGSRHQVRVRLFDLFLYLTFKKRREANFVLHFAVISPPFQTRCLV